MYFFPKTNVVIFIAYIVQLIPPDIVEILPEQRAVRGRMAGSGSIRLAGDRHPFNSFTTVHVTDDKVGIMMLDPLVGSLRLSVVSELPEDRFAISDVSAQILSVLSYDQERAEITASVILQDGRRVVIADPSLLQIQSSNESIVRVENNYIVANQTGSVYLDVIFIPCGRQIANRRIEVTVQIDQHRPMFLTDELEASIIENSVVGSMVTTVTARDNDFAEGEQTDTEYRIRDDPFDGLWVIDTITGEITLNGPIDREDIDRYELIVEATDRLQRQAEVSSRTDPNTVCVGGSGSGSGSGDCDGELIPEPVDPETPVLATPPDTISVS